MTTWVGISTPWATLIRRLCTLPAPGLPISLLTRNRPDPRHLVLNRQKPQPRVSRPCEPALCAPNGWGAMNPRQPARPNAASTSAISGQQLTRGQQRRRPGRRHPQAAMRRPSWLLMRSRSHRFRKPPRLRIMRLMKGNPLPLPRLISAPLTPFRALILHTCCNMRKHLIRTTSSHHRFIWLSAPICHRDIQTIPAIWVLLMRRFTPASARFIKGLQQLTMVRHRSIPHCIRIRRPISILS